MPRGKTWYQDRIRASIPMATNHLIVCCGAETEKIILTAQYDGI